MPSHDQIVNDSPPLYPDATERTPMGLPSIAYVPRPEYAPPSYRMVGEITAAQYDRAVELVAEPLTDREGAFVAIHPAILEHARWVLDRIDAGMLVVVAEDEDPDPPTH